MFVGVWTAVGLVRLEVRIVVAFCRAGCTVGDGRWLVRNIW